MNFLKNFLKVGYLAKKQWVDTHCKSFWYLEFNPEDYEEGIEYFNAALHSGYTKMIMYDHLQHNQNGLHSDTNVWKDQYDPKTGDIRETKNGRVIINTIKAHWFFCQPKTLFKSIQDGETHPFYINKAKYTECRYVDGKPFKIKKTIAGITTTFEEKSGFGKVICRIGSIDELTVSTDAVPCGLSDIFVRLCLIDANMNGDAQGNVGNVFPFNIALSDIKGYKESRLQWVKENCKNFWGMKFNPKNSEEKKWGQYFFEAALDSGYTEMLMYAKDGRLHPIIPGSDRTEYWRDVYDRADFKIKTILTISAPLTSWSTIGAHWFFCKPVREPVFV